MTINFNRLNLKPGKFDLHKINFFLTGTKPERK
jgi:hypothetical protein